MKTLAIELNDAAIAVARAGELLAVEPGCAIATGGGVAFGHAALQSRRLRPRDANDRYWSQLGVASLARPLGDAKHPADLAHAQLLALWNRFANATDEVLLAVPGSFDREQLGLLLGIAQACGMPVTGLVDAAIAACHCPYPGWDAIHVEAQLHGFALTRIGHARRAGVDESVAEDFEAVGSVGVAGLHERWARRIASAFVAQTRFDPLSDGKTEQRLFDALPEWLEAFSSLPSATVEFDLGHATRRIDLTRDDLLAEAAEIYDRLANRVAAARRPGRGLAVHVGAVLAGLPGATQRLAQIAGARAVTLPVGAGALGALACADDIRSRPGRTSLVRSLGWRTPAASLPPLRPEELEESGMEPTHLLIRATAYPIGAAGLELRIAQTGGFETRADSAADPADIVLRRSDAGLRVEPRAGVSVLVNAKPAPSGTRLRSGDRIAVLGSTEEAQLIAVSSDEA